MDHRERRTQSDYTLAFKLSVVRQVEKGELTYKQAQRCYGIQGRSTVLTPVGRAKSPTRGRVKIPHLLTA